MGLETLGFRGMLCASRDPVAAGQREKPRRFNRSRIVAITMVLLTTSAEAQTVDPTAFVQAGQGDRAVHSVAIGASRDFFATDPDNPSPWSFYGEVVLGEWFTHHHDAGQRTQFKQLTATPVARYTFGGLFSNVFVELGVGLSLITPHFEDHGRRFSTNFNFDDHASLGFRFGEGGANELSIRAEHFSNGGVRNPNPGQDFAQLRYARHF
jgi:lipid A 3-O-deacylase